MQQGFTLIELMIVIALIAILSSLGIPAYQGYLQKAAFTDVLQLMQPYKTAVELCALENGTLSDCSSGDQGIPITRATRYVSGITVNAGMITVTGSSSLQGLRAELTPGFDPVQGGIIWQKNCIAPTTTLVKNCQQQLRYDEAGSH